AAVEALLEDLRAARGNDRRLDAHLDATEAFLAGAGESDARRLTEALALALQGALLVRHAPKAVADAFCASRVAGDGGRTLGTLARAAAVSALVARAQPVAD